MSAPRFTNVVVIIMLVITSFYSIYPVQAAAPSSTAMLTINGGGGVIAGGTDGMKLTFNVANSGEQLVYRNKNFYYSNGDFGFHLNIGGVLYTSFNGSNASLELSEANKFDNLTISALTGTASISGGSSAGSGSALMTYTVTVGGRLYTVKRTITYIHPGTSYTDEYEIIIPTGNTANVVFYKGGDTAPYESDAGHAAYFDAPVRNVQSIDSTSGYALGMREVFSDTNMAVFDGAVSERYYYSYDEVNAGTNVGYGAEAVPTNGDPLDTGFMIQQNIGSTPGTYEVDNVTYVTDQAVKLEAIWANSTVPSLGRINLAIINNLTTDQSGVGFDFNLPSGLTAGAVYTNCTGTASATGGTITVSGVSMTKLSSCLLEVDVGSTTATTYTTTSANASNLTGITNAISSSSITFTYASPTFTRTPSPTLSPTNTLTPSNTRSPTNTLTPSLTPSETRTPTNTRTPSNTRTPTNTLTPTATSTANPLAMIDIAVGQLFVLGITTNGNVVTWGFNRDNQTLLPELVVGKSVREVEAGSNWALALLDTGSVVGWGANDFGQLNIPIAAQSNVKTISAFFGHALAIRNNGQVIGWGRNNEKQATIPSNLTNVKAVSAGSQHSLALLNNGNVVAWGKQTIAQPRFASTLRNITAISAGFDHSLALKNDGTVVCWLESSDTKQNVGQCRGHQNLKNIVAISAGRQFSIAVDNKGQVFGWGLDQFGQLAVKQKRSDVLMARAGFVNAVVAYADGSILTTGNSMHGARVSRTATSTGVLTPSPALPTFTPAPPTFTPRPTRRSN